MNLEDLQDHVGRMEASPNKAYERIADSSSLMPVRLLGAAVEMASDLGALSNLLLNWLYRGKPLDRNVLTDEVANLLMSVAGLCNAAGLNMEELIDLAKGEPTGLSPLAKVAQALDIQIEMEKVQDKRRQEQLPASYKDRKRTHSEVIAQRNSAQGCCSAFADMSSCNCLDEALPDHCGQMSNGLDCNVCERRLLGRLMSEVCPYRQRDKSETDTEHANYLKEF